MKIGLGEQGFCELNTFQKAWHESIKIKQELCLSWIDALRRRPGAIPDDGICWGNSLRDADRGHDVDDRWRPDGDEADADGLSSHYRRGRSDVRTRDAGWRDIDA